MFSALSGFLGALATALGLSLVATGVTAGGETEVITPGTIAAVGVAPPSKDGEDKADCLVDVVRKMKMPSPGSYAAKVSFTL